MIKFTPFTQWTLFMIPFLLYDGYLLVSFKFIQCISFRDFAPLSKKLFDHKDHNFWSNDSFTDCHRLAKSSTLLSHIFVETRSARDSRFDHGNSNTNSWSTYNYGFVVWLDYLANPLSEIRVVAGWVFVSAYIFYLDVLILLGQVSLYKLFKTQTCMIWTQQHFSHYSN